LSVFSQASWRPPRVSKTTDNDRRGRRAGGSGTFASAPPAAAPSASQPAASAVGQLHQLTQDAVKAHPALLPAERHGACLMPPGEVGLYPVNKVHEAIPPGGDPVEIGHLPPMVRPPGGRHFTVQVPRQPGGSFANIA